MTPKLQAVVEWLRELVAVRTSLTKAPVDDDILTVCLALEKAANRQQELEAMLSDLATGHELREAQAEVMRSHRTIGELYMDLEKAEKRGFVLPSNGSGR